MNRAQRRKQQQEIARLERKRHRELMRWKKKFDKKYGEEYLSDNEAFEMLKELYNGGKK